MAKRVKVEILGASKAPVIHHVHLVDGSGSMHGAKFRSAIAGVNKDIESAIKSAREEGIECTISALQFSSNLNLSGDGNILGRNMNDYSTFNPKFLNGSTRLYGSIADVIHYFLGVKSVEDRVLLKIFTDGQENMTESTSPYKNPRSLATLINKVEENNRFTITFVGTKQDTEYITRTINIDASNIATHDNTSRGIGETYNMMANSTAMYTKRMASGQDVTYDFFTQE